MRPSGGLRTNSVTRVKVHNSCKIPFDILGIRCYHRYMLKIIYMPVVQYSHSLKAKYQKRNLNGRFSKPLPTARQVEKNPMVKFFYPSSKTGQLQHRVVRLISATPDYMVGLEIISDQAKTRYRYKKFCQSKVQHFRLVEFNPKSMS